MIKLCTKRHRPGADAEKAVVGVTAADGRESLPRQGRFSLPPGFWGAAVEGRTGRHDVARRPCHCGFGSPAFSQQLEWTGHGVAGARAGPQGLAAAQRDTLLRVPRGCGGLPRHPRLPLCGAPFPARSLLSWAGGRLPTRRCDRGPRAPAGSGGSDQAEAQALGPQTGRAGRRVCPQDDRGRGLVRRPCAPALAAPCGFWRARRVLSVRVPAVGTQAEASVALTRDAASFRRGPFGAQPGPHGVGAGLRAQETESEEKGAPRRGEERRCPAALRVRRVPASVCLRLSSPLVRNGEGRIQKEGSPIPLRPYLRV